MNLLHVSELDVENAQQQGATADLKVKQEIKRHFYFLMWLGVYLFAVYWGSSFFTEQDASWHQVIIPDTSFTPSHISLFYGAFPDVHHHWVWRLTCMQAHACRSTTKEFRFPC